MARLSVAERWRIAGLGTDRLRRRAVAGTLASPFLSWRYGAGAVQLLIVPQDLRTADSSFWREIRLGQFGLAGSSSQLNGHSPFELRPPNAGWLAALHGFDWLRHFAATSSPEARDIARDLVLEWIVRHRGAKGVANRPDILGRRIVSWMSHANLVLEGADGRTYDTITGSLGGQLVRLSSSWRSAPPGYPRLLALIALTLAGISIANRERQLAEVERLLATELDRQILPDGGHVSRNPVVLVELLLDLLPLRQCFAARNRPIPQALVDAMGRMQPMLRHLRLGDGMLARFNGMGVASPAGLATVLAYDEGATRPAGTLGASGYVRMERAGTVLIVDAGRPPPLEHAATAEAGCLSFEMSSGRRLMFVNGGAPGAADADWIAASRATASHNTVSINERSSARMVRHAGLEEFIGAAPLRGPFHVTRHTRIQNGHAELIATHDGYRQRHELIHTRRIVLGADGSFVDGLDRIGGASGPLRLTVDLPYAVHFHLHPDVTLQREGEGAVRLTLPGGERWAMRVTGARISIEESIFFADSGGPRTALQIAARGSTAGETEIGWRLEREVGATSQSVGAAQRDEAETAGAADATDKAQAGAREAAQPQPENSREPGTAP